MRVRAPSLPVYVCTLVFFSPESLISALFLYLVCVCVCVCVRACVCVHARYRFSLSHPCPSLWGLYYFSDPCQHVCAVSLLPVCPSPLTSVSVTPLSPSHSRSASLPQFLSESAFASALSPWLCARARLCVSPSFSGSCPCLAFRLFLMPSRFCVSASHCLCRWLVRVLMRLPLMLSCLPTSLPLTISVGPRCTCSVSLAECVSLTVSASLQLSCHRVSLSGSVSQRLPSLAALALNFSDPLPSVSLPVSPLQLLSSLRLKFSPYHYLPVSLRIYSVSPDYLCLCITQTLFPACALKGSQLLCLSLSSLGLSRNTFFLVCLSVCAVSLTILLR